MSSSSRYTPPTSRAAGARPYSTKPTRRYRRMAESFPTVTASSTCRTPPQPRAWDSARPSSSDAIPCPLACGATYMLAMDARCDCLAPGSRTTRTTPTRPLSTKAPNTADVSVGEARPAHSPALRNCSSSTLDPNDAGLSSRPASRSPRNAPASAASNRRTSVTWHAHVETRR
jgi:hypothetical protein